MENAQVQTQTIPKVVIKKVIHAKRDRVFQAWTKPELIRQWLVPKGGSVGVSTNEPRVGGKYKHEMIKGVSPDSCATDAKPGEVMLHEGEYLEIKPPEKVVFTWNSPYVKNTRVTVELVDLGDSTEVWLTHELLETEELRLAHTGGWESCLENLEKVLTA